MGRITNNCVAESITRTIGIRYILIDERHEKPL